MLAAPAGGHYFQRDDRLLPERMRDTLIRDFAASAPGHYARRRGRYALSIQHGPPCAGEQALARYSQPSAVSPRRDGQERLCATIRSLLLARQGANKAAQKPHAALMTEHSTARRCVVGQSPRRSGKRKKRNSAHLAYERDMKPKVLRAHGADTRRKMYFVPYACSIRAQQWITRGSRHFYRRPISSPIETCLFSSFCSPPSAHLNRFTRTLSHHREEMGCRHFQNSVRRCVVIYFLRHRAHISRKCYHRRRSNVHENLTYR